MATLASVVPWKSVAVAAGLYFATVAFYRLFLHPLARFPGPKLAAATRWFEAYYDIIQNGQYTSKIAKMHERYGPIIRISPDELHINDPSFFPTLFRHEGRWDKYAWAVNAQSIHGATIFTADHDQHKARRQPLNPCFSKATVASRQGMIRKKLVRLCERISEFAETGRVLDIGAAISAFQRDVLTNYVLGKSYDDLEKEDFNAGMMIVAQAGGKVWRLTKHFPWYGPTLLSIPKDFLIKHGDELTANFMRYGKASEEETERLLSDAASALSTPGEKAQPTIVHAIVHSDLPPEDKTTARMWSDVATVTGAGFETTASVLRLVIYHVFNNSQILERLRAELATVAPPLPSLSDEEPELRVLEQLPYLTAILMEGMRLSPALGTRLQRIAPDRELVYDKWRIPAGTPVGMTTLFMHMNEELYPDPTRFEPQRWVDVDARKKADKTYAPFSRGARICLGMHLAWIDMYLVMSALVRRFNFDLRGLTDDYFVFESDQFIIGTKGKGVLEVNVTRRKP
ncbi:hypothetical protein QQZ08_005250 [Neonectria magnoliae]|uniref:Trichodiene oxygenase n=1 Tax=Neonectria magnoliae TaxID=2732573 RepID=A0ABR1I3S3_9HYPO